jgi:hypothetical protein
VFLPIPKPRKAGMVAWQVGARGGSSPVDWSRAINGC